MLLEKSGAITDPIGVVMPRVGVEEPAFVSLSQELAG